MSLTTPNSIRKFQRKLYRKAKREPDFRFYSLYDKIYRKDVLNHAYRLVKENGGGPGVDEQTFIDIEGEGLTDWLEDLRVDLKEGTYEPSPLKRVGIEKETGGTRPLSIPTIRDRVAQMAAKLVLEPVFEADFKDQAYGYRPNKSAQDAVEEVHDNLKEGYRHVVDADVAGYFDNIPHDQLLKAVANRVSDGSVLALIKAWLKVPVIEEDDEGNRTYSEGKSSTKGTPQGGVISPLLANIYINRFLKAWEGYGKGEYYDAVLVNYADDFVILSRGNSGARKALEWTEWAMDQMGLELNEDKTHLLFADEEDFDFLGYTFGRDYYRKTGRWYLAAKPSAKSVKSLKERVKRILGPSNKANWDFVKGKLNQLLSGWANYYSYGSRLLAYRSIDQYVYDAISRFIRRRKKISSRATRILSREAVFGDLGVRRLCHKPRG